MIGYLIKSTRLIPSGIRTSHEFAGGFDFRLFFCVKMGLLGPFLLYAFPS